MSQIPKAPDGQEVYLFPSTLVPPSSASEQHGAEPDFPEPAATNQSDIVPGVSGTIRPETASTKLPATIAIKDLAQLRTTWVDSVNTIQRVLRGEGDLTDVVNAVYRSLYNLESLPVSRFTVQFQGDSLPNGILDNFARWPVDDYEITAPAGYEIPDTASGPPRSPAMVIDEEGRLLVFYLIRKNGAPDDNKSTIVALRYDQGEHGAYGEPEVIATAGNTIADKNNTASFIDDLADFNEDGEVQFPEMAAVLFQGNVYLFLAFYLAGSRLQAHFYVFRFQPEQTSKFFLVADQNTGSKGDVNFVHREGGATTYSYIDGNISAVALSDRVIVAAGLAIDPGNGGDIERSVFVSSSPDLVNWSSFASDVNNFQALSDPFPAVTEENKNLAIKDFTFWEEEGFAADRTVGWACGANGRIWHTTNGGANWIEQSTPVTTGLWGIFVSGFSDDEYTVFACGDKGTLLRTVDSGKTWKIISISGSEVEGVSESDFVDSANQSRAEIGGASLKKVRFAKSNVGWVVGFGPKIIYTNDSGDTWQAIEPSETTGTLNDFVIDGSTSPYTIVAGGFLRRSRKSSPADKGVYRFVRITNAGVDSGEDLPNYDPSNEPDDYTFENPNLATSIDPSASYAVNAMIRRGGEIYACVINNVLVYSGGLWSANLLPTNQYAYGIWADTPADQIYLVLTNGGVLKTRDNFSTWVESGIASEKIAYAIDSPRDGAFVFGCQGNLWYQDRESSGTTYPSLLVLPNQEVLLAASNLLLGYVQVFKSSNQGRTWAAIGNVGTIDFDPVDLMPIASTVPRPNLVSTIFGEVLMIAGTRGVVSPDGSGEVWVKGDNRNLPLALGQLRATGTLPETQINRTRTTIEYGGLRLFSIVVNDAGNFEVHVGRQWSTASPVGCPLPLDNLIWAGIDDLKLSWPVTSLPVNDQWTMDVRYRYPASHIVEPSPRIFYRGDDEPTWNVEPNIVIGWDRTDADIQDAMGAGRHFVADSFVLFGTSFRRAFWEMSVPEYDDDDFPTDPADFTSYPMSSEIDVGTLTATAGDVLGHNIVFDEGKNWVPGQFRPGVVTYYVELPYAAFRILDNTSNALVIDHDPDIDGLAPSGIAAGIPYRVFSDRLISLGLGGMRGGQNVTSPAGTQFQYGRHIQIRIPEYPTPDQYRKIGTGFPCRQIAIRATRPEGERRRDPMDEGWRWQPAPNISEFRGLAGLVSVEHHGPIGQRWQFRYSTAKDWDRDMLLLPMLPKMRDPFVIIFDSNDLESARLVRLTSKIPEIAHRSADFFGYDLEIEEIT